MNQINKLRLMDKSSIKRANNHFKAKQRPRLFQTSKHLRIKRHIEEDSAKFKSNSNTIIITPKPERRKGE